MSSIIFLPQIPSIQMHSLQCDQQKSELTTFFLFYQKLQKPALSYFQSLFRVSFSLTAILMAMCRSQKLKLRDSLLAWSKMSYAVAVKLVCMMEAFQVSPFFAAMREEQVCPA